MHRQQGISLLELIIIVVIVSILTLLAVPSFISFLQNYRLTATAENLYYSLQYARTEAIKQNTTVYVSFQTGDTWCYGINTNSACNCATANACNLGAYNAPTPQQISLSTSGVSGGSLQFESTHGAANSSGVVSFTLYGQTTAISVNISVLGNLQMCSSQISGYSACP